MRYVHLCLIMFYCVLNVAWATDGFAVYIENPDRNKYYITSQGFHRYCTMERAHGFETLGYYVKLKWNADASAVILDAMTNKVITRIHVSPYNPKFTCSGDCRSIDKTDTAAWVTLGGYQTYRASTCNSVAMPD